jgi:succinyl-CoA synthetase beta subunit/citryl-CoA synthetase large subunit
MIIVEYEAKGLLQAQGLPLPKGGLAQTSAAAEEVATELGQASVVKSQIPMGGRMKAGGILFAETPAEAASHAQHLLGHHLLGFTVERLWVEQKLASQTEAYLAVTYDIPARRVIILAGLAGGIEVETIVGIQRYEVSLLNPTLAYMGREVAAQMGLAGAALPAMAQLINQLLACFMAWDALLLECNPVILDESGRWWIADVHLELDDEAVYRQQGLLAQTPYSQALANRRSDFEQRAWEIDHADHRGVAGRLIQFEGNLGLLIGGGGASLTVMDALLKAGFKPANYCEIGGNPSVWKIQALTKLILSQPQVEKLAVIMNVVSNTRVDLVARGVIKGILELGLTPSEVIAAFRIPGSWEDEGRLILEAYGIPAFDRNISIDQVVEAMR